jgi:kumamolisin
LAQQTDASGNAVVLTGTCSQVRKAFRPDHLGLYQDGARSFVARSGHLHLPADLIGDVVAVMGIDQRCRPLPPLYRPLPGITDAGTDAYLPAETAALYNFPGHFDGKGQTIGIIALGGGYEETSLQDYFHRTGVNRTGALTAVSVDGTSNNPIMGEDLDHNNRVREVQLDIEIVGSIAPAANIVVYFAGSQDPSGLIAALRRSITDSIHAPTVISVSWHYPEDIASSTYPGALDALGQVLQMAKDAHVTVCVASGDGGAYEDADAATQAVVSVPACSPLVLACGGTSRPRGQLESAWARSGGGFSSHFARPSYQGNVNFTTQRRGVPDVAALAAPGYAVLVNSSNEHIGGTSASAPLWAGLIALLNQRSGRALGFVNPILYANTDAFTDVVTGGNALFQASPGWDPLTGLGCPDGAKIANLF